MRTMSNPTTQKRKTPTQYQVKEITGRGLPVPPTYDLAQALIDSFEPSEPQQRRLDQHGLTAATRGEAKEVLRQYVDANPGTEERWAEEAAQRQLAQRQQRRGELPPDVTTQKQFALLAAHGVTNVPTNKADAAAMIDALPPSEAMAELLRKAGYNVPETRGEASILIDGLPATEAQTKAIVMATGGQKWPRNRGDAQKWFAAHPKVSDPEAQLAMAA
jgi:hypothetical protein